MHLVSPALPIGAYAYSQGLEYAVDSGWITGEPELIEWTTGLMEHGLGTLDLPLLARLLDAWSTQDYQSVLKWNDFARAARETSELLLEDEQLGLALNRLLLSLNVADADYPLKSVFVTQFALACHHWQIPNRQALYGFVFSWLENQIAAATKLVPFGQTQAQHILLKLLPKIEPVCANALKLKDDDMGLSLPGLALASCNHERQYSRLFRS